MNRKAYFLILTFFLIVTSAGLISRPYLGDEINHYRLAKGFFKSHERLAIDPVYEKSKLIYFYNSEPFWPALLGLVWILLGRESLVAAQIYHSFYFLCLLLFTYFLSKQLGDEKQAFLSILLLATIPMVVAFSILFYTEIPMMALLMLSVPLLLKKKTFLASLVISLAYLTKMTVLFFFPAFLWLIFKTHHSLKEKMSKSVVFTLPILITGAFDALWRNKHLNMTYLFSSIKDEAQTQSAWQALKERLFLGDAVTRLSEYSNSGLWEYTNASLLNIIDVFKYFGIVALVLFVLYTSRKGYKGNRISALFVASYFLFSSYVFILTPDIRYLLPIAPFLAIIASSVAIRYWHRLWFKFLIVGVCLLQLAVTTTYVLKERRISSEIQQGFAFIERIVPENMLVIYPEYVLVEKTDRGVIWSHRFRDKLTQLFWGSDKNSVIDYFTTNNIRYLAVKKNRIYDDSTRRHLGGYPRSFIGQLENLPYFKLMFENKEMSIWYIADTKG